jgi:hypothetical protein
MSFNDPLFNNYFRDTEDWVNLPLRDDAAAYEDENRIEMPGDFVEKLSKRTAPARREDDLNKSARVPEFKNPLGLEKGTVEFKLRIVRKTITENQGFRFVNGFDDAGKLVLYEPILGDK